MYSYLQCLEIACKHFFLFFALVLLNVNPPKLKDELILNPIAALQLVLQSGSV